MSTEAHIYGNACAVLMILMVSSQDTNISLTSSFNKCSLSTYYAMCSVLCVQWGKAHTGPDLWA